MKILKANSIGQLYDSKAYDTPLIKYIDTSGYHLYVGFNLTLNVTATQDSSGGRKYLQFINSLAQAGIYLARSTGAELLEIQNDKLHLVFPGPIVETESHLIRFSKSIYHFINQHLSPLLGDDLRSIKLCATYGRAIILNTGNQATDSTISLGPAANDPAKRLVNPEVNSGELHYRNNPDGAEWQKINLKDRTDADKIAYTTQIAQDLRGIINLHYLTSPQSAQPIFARQEIPASSVDNPYLIRGFYMRCDLDGFTKQVKDAFDKNSEIEIRTLVERFTILMGYADAYIQIHGNDTHRVTKLPWAGDCANILIFPPENTYDHSRKYYPPKAAALWFDIKSRPSAKNSPEFRHYLCDADWVASIAGGGNQADEGNGYLLVADIPGINRSFRIAAGWGARRSLDAHNAIVIQKNDTVLPDCDRSALDKPLAMLFTACSKTPTYFRKNNITLDDIKNASGQIPAVVTANPDSYRPKPKPFYDHRRR